MGYIKHWTIYPDKKKMIYKYINLMAKNVYIGKLQDLIK